MSASQLLAGVSRARLADLVLRQQAGTLTAAEALALNILAGGRLGEESIDKAIDAAQEEYGNGTYRVPVRVVGDPSRLMVVLTLPPHPFGEPYPQAEMDRVAEVVTGRVRSGGVMVLPAGSKLDLFEVAAGAVVEVDVRPPEGVA